MSSTNHKPHLKRDELRLLLKSRFGPNGRWFLLIGPRTCVPSQVLEQQERALLHEPQHILFRQPRLKHLRSGPGLHWRFYQASSKIPYAGGQHATGDQSVYLGGTGATRRRQASKQAGPACTRNRVGWLQKDERLWLSISHHSLDD